MEIHHGLLCEGLRQEVGGKFTLLGFYGVLPHVRIVIRDPEKSHHLAFVLLARNVKADEKLELAVGRVGREGKSLIPTVTFEPDEDVFGATFTVEAPVKFRQAGEYEISAKINGKPAYRDTFQVIHRTE